MTDAEDLKGTIRRFAPIFSWAIALCIPIATLSVPIAIYIYGVNSEDARTKQDYVRIALSILQKPNKNEAPQIELRKWAIQVLQKTSPVELSCDAIKSLISGKSNLPLISMVRRR